MKTFPRSLLAAAVSATLAVSLAACGRATPPLKNWPRSDALWHIVDDECVPNQQLHGQPEPCREVNLQEGWVILKDRNGVLQYLYVPVRKISGIEDPQLLEPQTLKDFWLAWQARRYMTELHGEPIDDRNVMITVNSQYGRSQNQLHLHISCIRPDIKSAFASYRSAQPAQGWQQWPAKLANHHYIVREITPQQLKTENVYELLAQAQSLYPDPQPDEDLGKFGLAMLKLNNGNFMLLATRVDRLRFNRASAEELQDHDCSVLPRK